MAAANVARACPTAAVSSSADSSATTSLARTLSPLRTLIAASWPPTSGATRICVARTSPITGAGDSGRCRKNVAPPAATRAARPSHARRRRLANVPPPPNHGHRRRREREVDGGKDAEPGPIARHLPQRRAELVDADDSVDREIGGEDSPRDLDHLRDGLARPGETGREELRQAGSEEDEGRGFRVPEPGPHRLAEEAGREDEQR